MVDATRDGAILWCTENEVSFVDPLFPPPSGWAWIRPTQGTGLHHLYYSSMAPNDYEDIYFEDVIG